MPEPERRTMPRKPGARSAFERDGAMERRLGKALEGWTVYAFPSVSSTMELAHERADGGPPKPPLVSARRQEQGRGRLGRTWASPEGGAYFSVILRPKRPVREISQLSLVSGLAAAEAVNRLTGLYPAIRWPNDLLLEGRKLAGILTESRNGAVVLGIGINVTTEPDDLPDGAVSLTAALGSTSDLPPPPARPGVPGRANSELIDQLTIEVCRRLAKWYDTWSRKGFDEIRAALRPRIGLFGQVVHVTTGSDYFEGTAQDLDELGRLVVRLDSGIQRAFEVGEVTLLR